jgi:hypothetical protein
MCYKMASVQFLNTFTVANARENNAIKQRSNEGYFLNKGNALPSAFVFRPSGGGLWRS